MNNDANQMDENLDKFEFIGRYGRSLFDQPSCFVVLWGLPDFDCGGGKEKKGKGLEMYRSRT